MACLLHDVGKSKLPKELLKKRPWEMTPEELSLYQTHPELGAEMVEDSSLVTNTVKQIILQHHEYYDGTGFPNEKSRNTILTLANIVCIADDFVHIMTDRKIKPVDALQVLSQEKYDSLTRYNPSIVEGFLNTFIDPKINKKAS